MSLAKVSNLSSGVSFNGYDKKLDKKGNVSHTFYYPHSSDYDLKVELLFKQKNGDKIVKTGEFDIDNDALNLSFKNGLDTQNDMFYRFKLTDKNNPKASPLYVIDNGLVKNLGKINGSSEPFNQVFPDRAIVSKPGRMQLQVPDIYYPGVKYNGSGYVLDKELRAKALSTLRTHVGKLGGTLDGMIAMLPQKAKEGYTRIVGTPFTKDEVSSHLYWTQNAYQMSSALGGLKDMKRFQQELFRNGINFVSDASLVNEGMQGIHFSNLLKWGEDSPFFHWFKTYDLDSNTISLGVIPENAENVRMKIINSPVKIAANPVKNERYNPKKPTYIQLYDERLTSDEQKKSDKVFTKYENNVGNHYEISGFDDAIIPYAFEVNPNELAQNLKKIDKNDKDAFSDIDTIKNLLVFRKFTVGEKKDGGVELWDGNVDIIKLNFSFGNYDFPNLNKKSSKDLKVRIADYKQGVREVQDYAVLSGKYWTKLAADTQLEYAANSFKNIETTSDVLSQINKSVGKTLPASVRKIDKAIIDNVLKDDYNLFKLNSITSYTKTDAKGTKTKVKTRSYDDVLIKSIMNLPFEVLEVGDDVSSILSTGYLTKRASTDNQIGLTRFDIYKSGYPNLNKKYADLYKKTDNLLREDVYSFVDSVLTEYSKFENAEKIKDKSGNLTAFGAYVINTVVPELTKFALIKALDKNANITTGKDGSLNFDNIDRTNLGVRALGLTAMTPKGEAENLVKKFADGLKDLNENQAQINKLATALYNRLSGLNEKSFKIADMIIDRTESGMGLRVDAAKDIAAMDSVRATSDDISKAWNDVIKFWSLYVKEGVQKENPHDYTTAEVTDIDKFIGEHPIGKLNSAPEADRNMLEKVGVTSLANYSYFFSMPTGIYSVNPETGNEDGFGVINGIKEKLDGIDNTGWIDNLGMLFQGTPDSSIHSYTFSGNHDKPRILHVLGLDMGLYNSDFESKESKEDAADVLMLGAEYNPEEVGVDNFDFSSTSAPAIAMGKRLKDVIRSITVLNDEEKTKILRDIRKGKAVENDELNHSLRVLSKDDFNKISRAIAKLARGVFQVGDDVTAPKIYFNPDAFGQRPFDVVIKDVFKSADLDIDDEQLGKIKDLVFERMLAPAMEKYKSIYKMLTLLPGDPTDFAGDKEGMTGFESKSKNITQQNRNAIRWEWVNEKSPMYKPFIAKYKKEMNDIMALRTRPELSALNDGHTVSLVNWTNAKEYDSKFERVFCANLRYNAEGSKVITIFGKPDLEKPNPSVSLGDKVVKLPYINLSSDKKREGLVGGLTVGTEFKNANENDNSVYKVELANINIPVRVPNDYNKEKEVVYKTFSYENEQDDIRTYIYKQEPRYILKRYVNGEEADIEISKKDDNALVLYKV